jgi:hypothetical protein
MKKELIVSYEWNYYKMVKVAVQSKKDIIRVDSDTSWIMIFFVVLSSLIGLFIWVVAC